MKISKTLLFLVLGVLAAGVPLLAHHGTNASYDMDKIVTVKGTVTEFIWSNPHCQLFLDVKDDKGNVSHWVGETNSPGVLERSGWSRKIMRPGDQITVSLHPSKAGATVGVVQTIVLGDGKVLERGGGAGQ